MPSKYLSLQNLCLSTVIHHYLYESGEILLPARISQSCQIFSRNQDNCSYLYPIMPSNARLLRYFPHIKEMKKFICHY